MKKYNVQIGARCKFGDFRCGIEKLQIGIVSKMRLKNR